MDPNVLYNGASFSMVMLKSVNVSEIIYSFSITEFCQIITGGLTIVFNKVKIPCAFKNETSFPIVSSKGSFSLHQCGNNLSQLVSCIFLAKP